MLRIARCGADGLLCLVLSAPIQIKGNITFEIGREREMRGTRVEREKQMHPVSSDICERLRKSQGGGRAYIYIYYALQGAQK